MGANRDGKIAKIYEVQRATFKGLSLSLSRSLATDENRLILCSQNGQVRIINRDTAEFNSFYVLFRGFQANILADDSANGILVQVSKVPLLSNNYA